MKIKINEANGLSKSLLLKWGFSKDESEIITDTLIDAELCGRKTHGLVRLLGLKKDIEAGKVKVNTEEVGVVRETPVLILVDGKEKPGLYVINKALELGITKIRQSGLLAVGCTNTAPSSGMIGHYARIAAENNLIFIGFNNSAGGLVPHGAIKELFGTNPLTVGVPTNNLPVILDMASSQIPWGKLLLAKAANEKISEGVAIDANGEITTDPAKAMEGGLLPIAEHKGSGLAFIVELLAGALTKSRVGTEVKGGWGTFFILIDPSIFRNIEEFKRDVETGIKELKSLPRAKNIKEIYYPGERSQKLRQEQIGSGKVEVDDKLWEQIKAL